MTTFSQQLGKALDIEPRATAPAQSGLLRHGGRLSGTPQVRLRVRGSSRNGDFDQDLVAGEPTSNAGSGRKNRGDFEQGLIGTAAPSPASGRGGSRRRDDKFETEVAIQPELEMGRGAGETDLQDDLVAPQFPAHFVPEPEVPVLQTTPRLAPFAERASQLTAVGLNEVAEGEWVVWYVSGWVGFVMEPAVSGDTQIRLFDPATQTAHLISVPHDENWISEIKGHLGFEDQGAK